MNVIHCKLLTPNHVIFDQNILTCTLPGIEGEIGILFGHEELIVGLKKGLITITSESKHHYKTYEVSDGFARIDGKNCIIMVDDAKEKTV